MVRAGSPRRLDARKWEREIFPGIVIYSYHRRDTVIEMSVLSRKGIDLSGSLSLAQEKSVGPPADLREGRFSRPISTALRGSF